VISGRGAPVADSEDPFTRSPISRSPAARRSVERRVALTQVAECLSHLGYVGGLSARGVYSAGEVAFVKTGHATAKPVAHLPAGVSGTPGAVHIRPLLSFVGIMNIAMRSEVL